VCSKTREQADRFVDTASCGLAAEVEAVASIEEAVGQADIVCTVTSSQVAVLKGKWLRAGVHVNAVGACAPAARELDGAAVQRSRLFVDRRESTLSEAGDFLLARKEGLVANDHIVAEIGEVLAKMAEGRRSADEITLFKSVGLGVQDVAAAVKVYGAAIKLGVGTEVDMGGRRRAS
jgi:ornithine cyclodeaminase